LSELLQDGRFEASVHSDYGRQGATRNLKSLENISYAKMRASAIFEARCSKSCSPIAASRSSLLLGEGGGPGFDPRNCVSDRRRPQLPQQARALCSAPCASQGWPKIEAREATRASRARRGSAPRYASKSAAPRPSRKAAQLGPPGPAQLLRTDSTRCECRQQEVE
jgi:hypothetical protein